MLHSVFVIIFVFQTLSIYTTHVMFTFCHNYFALKYRRTFIVMMIQVF